METKVTGVFRNSVDADEVRSTLKVSGIDDSNISVLYGSESTGGGTRAQQNESFWDQVRDFFSLEEESTYSEASQRGSPVVVATVDNSQVDDVVDIMQRHNPVDINEEADKWKSEGWSLPTEDRAMGKSAQVSDQSTSIPVVEEQLKVGKRQESRGGVRVHSKVTEKPVEERVELRDETVHVDRKPVNRKASSADFKEESFAMQETHEEPVINKEAKIVEEVTLSKDIDTHTETIKDTAKRKDVDIEEDNKKRERPAAAS